jgi:hypothetical protein
MALRLDQIEAFACRQATLDGHKGGRCHFTEGDGLDQGFACADRHYKRESCERPQHGRGAIGRCAENKAGTQDDPIQSRCRERFIGFKFRGHEQGRSCRMRAHSRDLHDPLRPMASAGLEQGPHGPGLDKRNVVIRSVLKHAGGTDDRIHPGKERRPSLGCRHFT